MTTTTVTLTQIVITKRLPNFKTGRRETWAAESVDGLWFFDRIEEASTPWSVTRTGYDGFVLTGSLPSAQRITASGYALAQLERQQREMAQRSAAR